MRASLDWDFLSGKRLKQLERSKANLERDIDDIVDSDNNAIRKRKDMNRRLDGIYDEMRKVEDSIAECQKMKETVGGVKYDIIGAGTAKKDVIIYGGEKTRYEGSSVKLSFKRSSKLADVYGTLLKITPDTPEVNVGGTFPELKVSLNGGEPQTLKFNYSGASANYVLEDGTVLTFTATGKFYKVKNDNKMTLKATGPLTGSIKIPFNIVKKKVDRIYSMDEYDPACDDKYGEIFGEATDLLSGGKGQKVKVTLYQQYMTGNRPCCLSAGFGECLGVL